MIPPMARTSRTFSFDLPPGAFPALLERVRGTPARAEVLTAADPTNRATEEARHGDTPAARLIEWVYFVAEHDDHHLARARQVLRQLSGGFDRPG